MTKQMECATEIAKWLGKNGLYEDLCIYVDHKRYKVNEKGELIFDIEAEPRDYFEYAGDFLSMSFEGPLYSVLNGYNDFAGDYDTNMETEFSKILEKYGKYYELGNAWNLSLYNL